jgi:hypothetical protein
MNTNRDYTQIEFGDDSVMVYQPRFANAERTKVKALIVLPNGQIKEIEKECADRSSKIVRDIFLQYTEAEILEFTEREQAVLAKKSASDARGLERQIREQEQAIVFQAKVNALDLPEVKNFADKNIARRIRKAKNPIEVAALVALVFQQSYQNETRITD